MLSEAQTLLADFLKKKSDDDAEKTELEARIEGLKELDKNYEDPGVILDCVVFHDGKDWRAVIDVNENGDLSGKCKNYYSRNFLPNTVIFFM